MRTTHRRNSSIGFRYSTLAIALACVIAPNVTAQTPAPPTSPYTVRSGGDSFMGIAPAVGAGTGTLRQAIVDANFSCTTGDQITFAGAFTVALSAELPPIACSGLKVVGSGNLIQPDAAAYGGPPLSACGLRSAVAIDVGNLEISGFSSGPGLCGTFSNVKQMRIHDNLMGIQLDGPSYVGGTIAPDRNYIFSNSTYGIWVSATAAGTTLSANTIGADRTSSAPPGNPVGILAETRTNIYGNHIAGGSVGIHIDSGGVDIQGNKIGTDPTGNLAGWGMAIGILVDSRGSGTSITNRNLVSGNATGIVFDGASAGTVSGNLIGTNAGGTGPLPNGLGVVTECGSANINIGNNTISGNGTGVAILASSNIAITNNRIGLADDGVSALGNSASGVMVGSVDCAAAVPDGDAGSDPKSLSKVLVASSANTIAGNKIVFNGQFGVGIQDGSTGNAIVGNNIYANGLKNIDLLNDTVTPTNPRPNDPSDTDSGPNNGQNYPDITGVTRAAGVTTVTFVLDSTPGDYKIELFSNDTPGRAGKNIVGSATLTITTGPASGSIAVSGTTADNFTATATRTTGTPETSEFSDSLAFTAAPAVNIAPASNNFGDVYVGSSSLKRQIKLVSSGATPWILASLSRDVCGGPPFCSSAGFICSTDCKPGVPLNSGQGCVIDATFAPTVVGSLSTRIAVCDNTGSTQTIDLLGNGVIPPPIHIQPDRFDFGPAIVGRPSASQRFDVVNPSAIDVAIGAFGTTGPFEVVASNCPASLPALSNCGADVRFVPTQATELTGSLFVPLPSRPGASSPNSGFKAAPAGSAISLLSGRGVDLAQIETPSTIDFGMLSLGGTPIVRTASITSTGNAVININSITVSGPFVLVHDCPINLPLQNNCTLTVTFSSTTVGPASGTISIASNASGSPRVIVLSGLVQLKPAPVITVNPVAISFGSRLIGTQSPSVRLTIANEGGAAAALGPLSTSVDYVIVNSSCTATLASRETCFADVAMRPVGFGDRSADFFFTSNAEASPHRVHINGIGCRPFSTGNNRTGGGNSACSP